MLFVFLLSIIKKLSLLKMENYYSLQESDLLHEIIAAVRRNEHGLFDFIVQDILRDRDFKDLLDREIEIKKGPEEPEEPERNQEIQIQKNQLIQMIHKIQKNQRRE